jgi:sec-independent protein translocase protein TatA
VGLSLSHLLLVLVVVLIVFGAGKLPQIMGDLAKGLKAFKHGLNESDTSSASTKTTPPFQKSPSGKSPSTKSSSIKSSSEKIPASPTESTPSHTP